MARPKGEPLRTHRKSRLFIVASVFIALVSLAAAIFGAADLIYRLVPPPMSSANDLQLAVGGGALLVFSVYLLVVNLRAPNFHIHENGIAIVGRTNSFVPFEAIDDVRRFASGGYRIGLNNLAFRREGDDRWYLISAAYSGGAMHEELLAGFVPCRTAVLLDRIARGGAAEFHYEVPNATSLTSLFALNAKMHMAVPTRTLRLDAQRVTIAGRSFPLSSLKPVGRVQLDRFAIQTRQDSRLLEFGYAEFWNFDVFCATFNALIERQAQRDRRA